MIIKPGDKVVCINDLATFRGRGININKGSVYTLIDIRKVYNNYIFTIYDDNGNRNDIINFILR